MALQQSDKRYLIYKDQIKKSFGVKQPALHLSNELWFWSERLVLIESEYTDGFWRFQAFDLLTSELRSISFPKSDSHFDEIQIFPLAKNYAFIVESIGERDQFNLVKIHWKTGEIQVFEQFETEAYDNDAVIIVDKSRPSKFVVENNIGYQPCELIDGKIKFGDTQELNYYAGHYFNDKLFVFDYSEEQNENFVIVIYDMLSKKTHSFQIEALPGYSIDVWNSEWIKNRVYAVVDFDDGSKSGIAWTDSKTKRFTLLDLTVTVPIQKLKFFDGNLLAFANESEKQNGILTSTVEVHSIPMRRPHSLRQMAWLLVVQEMKNSGVDDPYKEATRYLPFNTDLRAPWYTDEVDDQNEANKNQNVMDESKKKSSPDAVPSKRHKPN